MNIETLVRWIAAHQYLTLDSSPWLYPPEMRAGPMVDAHKLVDFIISETQLDSELVYEWANEEVDKREMK